MKKAVFIVVAILLIGGATAFGYFSKVYGNVIVHTPLVNLPFMNPTTPTPTPDPLAPYSILVLGYGGANHDGGYLTDTIIVARIAPKNKTVHLIAIPRDVWVDLPITKDGTEPHKINFAYAVGLDNRRYTQKPADFAGKGGGGAMAKYATGLVTGFPIDYFVAVSFAGFEKSIDVLGGVDVHVPATFDDPLYPIEDQKENDCGKSPEDIEAITATLSGTLLEKEFPCRYETLHFDKGLEHMDGSRSLKFVRSRKSEIYGGDFNRSLRQEALLHAVKDKIISVNFIPKIFPFISSLTSDMQTDINPLVVADKLKVSPDITSLELKTISISSEDLLMQSRSDDGQFILVPTTSWDAIHSYIRNQLEE